LAVGGCQLPVGNTVPVGATDVEVAIRVVKDVKAEKLKAKVRDAIDEARSRLLPFAGCTKAETTLAEDNASIESDMSRARLSHGHGSGQLVGGCYGKDAPELGKNKVHGLGQSQLKSLLTWDETTLTLFYFNLRGRTPAPSGQFADESSTTGSPMWSHPIGQPVGLQKRFSAVSVLEPNDEWHLR